MKELVLATFCLAALATDQVLRYFERREATKRYANKTKALARAIAEADPRLKLSALELGRAIKSGEISSVELTQLFIVQLERTNLYTNAMVGCRFDLALQDARKADAKLNTAEAQASPFWGVPIFSKEVFELPGMPYSAGVVKLANRYGKQTCFALQQVQSAGMIILGSGNVSEQCMWMESANKVYGKSNNLYDCARSTGGSSGGTACVVSSLGSPLAVTSDVGGSTRIPSLFNGVFGLKPTGGTVSNQGTTPGARKRVNLYCQLGPCARHAEDLFLLLKILCSKQDGTSAASHTFPTKSPQQAAEKWTCDEVEEFRVFNLWRQPDTVGPLRMFRHVRDKDMLTAHENLVQHVKTMFPVQDVDFPDMNRAFDIWSAYLGMETQDKPFRIILSEGHNTGYAGSVLWSFCELFKYAATLGRWSNHTLPALLLAVLQTFENLFPGKARRLVQVGENLKADISSMLGENGVMIVPSLPTVAPKHGFVLRASECSAAGIFNVLEFPSVAVPLGLDSNGMPVGVQVVSNHGNDHLCLSFALKLQRAGLAQWTPPITI